MKIKHPRMKKNAGFNRTTYMLPIMTRFVNFLQFVIFGKNKTNKNNNIKHNEEGKKNFFF